MPGCAWLPFAVMFFRESKQTSQIEPLSKLIANDSPKIFAQPNLFKTAHFPGQGEIKGGRILTQRGSGK